MDIIWWLSILQRLKQQTQTRENKMIIYFDNPDQYTELSIEVTSYIEVQGNTRADNPDDFYGYYEIEYDIKSADIYDDNTEVNIYTHGESLEIPNNICEESLREKVREEYLSEIN